MIKQLYTLLFSFFCVVATAQIKGKVTNSKKNALPYVSIYLKNTSIGTTTNNDGLYNINIKKTGSYIVGFQFLGYKTIEKQIEINTFPYTLNVTLTPEEVVLDEVLISSKENPANAIIKKVIANKKNSTEKQKNYTANFYSRGLFRVKNAPKKFMGQPIVFPFPLDSTRSGIIYLSETISKIKHQKKPKRFKEHIIASKVSGQDNGISFNQADNVNFNLYQNQITINGKKLFSPISDYAFSYYRYKLEGSFYENGKLISKIHITPKRKNDRVFSGDIYIVENDQEVYGANLITTGEQIGSPMVKKLHIKQNYTYNPQAKSWVITLQTIDFKAGMLGFNFNGRFSASYRNYNFIPNFTTNSFDDTILSFEKNATKKDSTFWTKLRTVPLTIEEQKDYVIKDSIKTLRKSKKYLDSIDVKQNKFGLLSSVTGYTFQNSYKKWTFNYNGLLDGFDYNTIQGFAPTVNFNYTKRINDYGNNWTLGTNLNYGFSNKKLLPSFYFSKRWNNFNKPALDISLGKENVQFDNRNPISKLNNAIYTLIEKRNYAKLYEKSFIKAMYSKEVARGVRLFSSLEYTNRKPLFNTTDYAFFKKNRTFFTNNPIDRTLTVAPFKPHHIYIANIAGRFNFGNKYIKHPNTRYNVKNPAYPTVLVGYRKTFGSNNNTLHSDLIWTRVHQKFSLGNTGTFQYNTRAGLFLKQKNIPFMDYYHPLGNETIFASENRLNRFYNLPYYQLSTNKKYAEIHTEHNFKGFILGKIPLLNKLNFHTVLSGKSYFSANNKPHTEFAIGLDNIGWGKWRFLRVDYVRSNYNGTTKNAFIFGISF